MTPSDKPVLSIIVVSYNTRDMTLACLDSITASASHEVIVIDNASTDGSAQSIAEHHPDVRLTASAQNLGFARANNLAAQEARGDFLLLLNPDTVVKAGALDKLIAFAGRTPDAKIWGGRTTFADGTLNPTSCFANTTLWSLFCRATGLTAIAPSSETFNPETYGRWSRDTERDVDIVTGCYFLIERAFWNRLGGFDPDFFMYGEEVDLCLRAVDLGARPRVTPASEIIHYGGASEPVRSDRMVKVLTAKVSLMRRHWSLPRAKAGVALLAAWPLTRWCALAIAARLSGNPIWHARADEWAEIFRRRNIWLAGYAPQQRVQPPSAPQQHGSHRRAPDPQPSSAVAAQSRPEISVLIPHLDDPGNLAVCIKALRNQTLASDRYEIVVCDNGSQCGLQPVWQAAGGATVVTTAEKGAGPARNAAFAASRGRILAFTDSDCIPANDWLEKGLAALEHADLAGGHVRVGMAGTSRVTGTEAFEQVFAFDNERYVKELGFSVTANLFAWRAVFEQTGGFHNGIPEDADWCRRAREKGFRLVYAQSAMVTHPARGDFAALEKKWRRLTAEAFAEWRHAGRSQSAWIARAAAVLLSPAAHLPRIVLSPKLSGTQDRLAAASILIRIRAKRAWWMAQQGFSSSPGGTAPTQPTPSGEPTL